MTFTEGQQQNMFTITSMNDDDIEFTEQFDVQLVYSNGGSRIATNGTLLSGKTLLLSQQVLSIMGTYRASNVPMSRGVYHSDY